MGNEGIVEFAGPLLSIALVVVLATMADPKVGLALIVFSVILSPELHIGKAYFRAEDFLLVLGTLAWVAVSALLGKRFRPTSLNRAIFIFLFWNVLSYGNQLIFGNVSPVTHTSRSVLYSSLTLLKKIEYFFVFFLTANVLSSKQHIKAFLWLMLLSLIVVDSYAIIDSIRHGYSVQGDVYRVSAPFDPEPNTFGQYLMIHILLILSLYPVVPLAQRIGLLAFILPFTAYAFLFTYSRGSYFALLGSTFLLGFFKDKTILAGWFVLVLLSAAIFPQTVIHRVKSGVNEIEDWRSGTAIATENAFYARVQSFKEGFQIATRYPLLGSGIGLVPQSRTEAQLPREALETGFVGLALFLWLMWEVFKLGWNLARHNEDPLFAALGWGIVLSLLGYTISGFSAIPFTTIRTAVPFWLLVGMGSAASFITQKQKTHLHFASFEDQKDKVYTLIQK